MIHPTVLNQYDGVMIVIRWWDDWVAVVAAVAVLTSRNPEPPVTFVVFPAFSPTSSLLIDASLMHIILLDLMLNIIH